MQAVIYAGLRNAARDQAIAAAMENESAATVGLIYSLSPSAVYGARRRITSLATFDLKLLGGEAAQCSLEKSPPSHSERLHSEPTETTTAPSVNWSCPAG